MFLPLLTSIEIESNIYCISYTDISVIMNCECRYVTAIYSRCRSILLSITNINSLVNSILIDIARAREWKSCSIRKVPVSSVWTLCVTAAFTQISVTLNTVTTTGITPHKTEVHIAIVCQSLSIEADIWKCLSQQTVNTDRDQDTHF